MKTELKDGDKLELSSDINVITAEIKMLERSMLESYVRHAWMIGERLNHAKDTLKHGNLTGWIADNFEFTHRYAQEFMKFHRQNPNSNSLFEGIQWTQIREIMSLPPEIDRQEFVEQTHTIPTTGAEKTVDEMTVRELREVKAELKKTQEERDAERTEREQAEQRAKLAESQAETAFRSEELMREQLEEVVDGQSRASQFEGFSEKETEDTRPYGVKLSDEIYRAFDELSEWQKEYAWLLTDRDEFKLLAEANPDFARQFQRLDKFWRQMSDAFHSVEMKGVYNTEAPEQPETIDAEFTEIH